MVFSCFGLKMQNKLINSKFKTLIFYCERWVFLTMYIENGNKKLLETSSSHYSLNLTICCISVSSKRATLSTVRSVTFLFFRNESNVFLSTPIFSSWYCDMPFSFMVSNNGEKSIITKSPCPSSKSIICRRIKNMYCGDMHHNV